MADETLKRVEALLARMATALEANNQATMAKPPAEDAAAFIWQAHDMTFMPVAKVNRIPLGLLQGIDGQQDQLMENTRRFANGLAANNALLWGQEAQVSHLWSKRFMQKFAKTTHWF